MKTARNFLHRCRLRLGTDQMDRFLAAAVAGVITGFVIAAGKCPTATQSKEDCGPTAQANCNLEIKWPGPTPQAHPCVSVSTIDNRKKGLCAEPYDKTKNCFAQPGSVISTYVRYEIICDAQGKCVTCGRAVVEATMATNDCPTTYQGSADDPACISE